MDDVPDWRRRPNDRNGAAEIATSSSPEALEQVRIKYLGRRGSDPADAGLGALAPEERRAPAPS